MHRWIIFSLILFVFATTSFAASATRTPSRTPFSRSSTPTPSQTPITGCTPNPSGISLVQRFVPKVPYGCTDCVFGAPAALIGGNTLIIGNSRIDNDGASLVYVDFTRDPFTDTFYGAEDVQETNGVFAVAIRGSQTHLYTVEMNVTTNERYLLQYPAQTPGWNDGIRLYHPDCTNGTYGANALPYHHNKGLAHSNTVMICKCIRTGFPGDIIWAVWVDPDGLGTGWTPASFIDVPNTEGTMSSSRFSSGFVRNDGNLILIGTPVTGQIHFYKINTAATAATLIGTRSIPGATHLGTSVTCRSNWHDMTQPSHRDVCIACDGKVQGGGDSGCYVFTNARVSPTWSRGVPSPNIVGSTRGFGRTSIAFVETNDVCYFAVGTRGTVQTGYDSYTSGGNAGFVTVYNFTGPDTFVELSTQTIVHEDNYGSIITGMSIEAPTYGTTAYLYVSITDIDYSRSEYQYGYLFCVEQYRGCGSCACKSDSLTFPDMVYDNACIGGAPVVGPLINYDQYYTEDCRGYQATAASYEYGVAFPWGGTCNVSCDGSSVSGTCTLGVCVPAASCSPSASSTVTPTPTSSITPSPTSSNTPTNSPTQTSTMTPTETSTQTITSTPTETPSVTPTPTATQTSTGTSTASVTPTNTPTSTGTGTATTSPSVSQTSSETPTPSQTPSATGSDTPSPTPTPTPTGSDTPSPTPTPTATQTMTPTTTTTASVSSTPSTTASESVTPSTSPSSSSTSTQSVSPTVSFSSTNTISATPTPTTTETLTSTPTPTASTTSTLSESPTPTPTNTVTQTPSNTPTNTPSNSQSNTPTPTPTSSPTGSDLPTPTPTSSITPTETSSPSTTPSLFASESNTPSISASSTASESVTPTPTETPSVTPTPSPSFSTTQTESTTPTPTTTNTNTATQTPTATTTITETTTTTVTATVTPTTTTSLSQTPTPTSSPSASETPTSSMSFSETPTSSVTTSPTSSITLSPTPSTTDTPTPTPTTSATLTATPTPTNTASPSTTATATITPTPTTATPSKTSSFSSTSTLIQSPSPTSIITATPTQTTSPSSTVTPTTTRTPTPCPSASVACYVYDSSSPGACDILAPAPIGYPCNGGYGYYCDGIGNCVSDACYPNDTCVGIPCLNRRQETYDNTTILLYALDKCLNNNGSLLSENVTLNITGEGLVTASVSEWTASVLVLVHSVDVCRNISSCNQWNEDVLKHSKVTEIMTQLLALVPGDCDELHLEVEYASCYPHNGNWWGYIAYEDTSYITDIDINDYTGDIRMCYMMRANNTVIDAFIETIPLAAGTFLQLHNVTLITNSLLPHGQSSATARLYNQDKSPLPITKTYGDSMNETTLVEKYRDCFGTPLFPYTVNNLIVNTNNLMPFVCPTNWTHTIISPSWQFNETVPSVLNMPPTIVIIKGPYHNVPYFEEQSFVDFGIMYSTVIDGMVPTNVSTAIFYQSACIPWASERTEITLAFPHFAPYFYLDDVLADDDVCDGDALCPYWYMHYDTNYIYSMYNLVNAYNECF